MDYFLNEFRHFPFGGSSPNLTIKACSFKLPRAKTFDNIRFSSGKRVYFFSKYKGIFTIRVRIDGLCGKHTIVSFKPSPFLNRLIFFKLVVPLIKYKLHEAGYTIIKASAIATATGATLYIGPSGSGKTNTILRKMHDPANRFISDTFTIIGKGFAFPTPFLFHLFSRNIKNLSFELKDVVAISFRKIFACLTHNHFQLSLTKDVYDLFGERVEENPQKIEKVVALPDGGELKKEKAIKKIIINDKYEFMFFEKLRLAYLYNFQNRKLEKFWETEENILRESLGLKDEEGL